MTLKTMAELNANQPHLRDLEITVDGLNVVDIQLAGPGVWAPRFTVQISGDRGLDDTTGQRSVYLQAAEYLRSVLLPNGQDDGTQQHAFVPHANLHRADPDADIEAAVVAANAAIGGLMALYKGVKIDETDEMAAEGHYECHTHALHIHIRSVDFDLAERTVLPAKTIDRLNVLLGESANPTPELTALTNRKADAPAEPELFVSNVTKSFDGVLHASVVLEGSFVAPNQVYWIPANRVDEFPSLEAIRRGTVLTCVANSNDWVEYLVQLPTAEVTLSEVDVRATTVLIDGIPHKRFERQDNGRQNVFWVPETIEAVIDQNHEIPDDLLMVIIAEDDNGNLEWRVTGRK